MTSAPPPTSRRWCSATSATTRVPACASPVTLRPARRSPLATTCPGPRAKTWLPVSATPSPSTIWQSSTRMSMPSCSRVMDNLERHTTDMADIEFTVERGRLWILQTRSGKRTAAAAVRTAVEMEREGLDRPRHRSHASRSGSARAAGAAQDRRCRPERRSCHRSGRLARCRPGRSRLQRRPRGRGAGGRASSRLGEAGDHAR